MSPAVYSTVNADIENGAHLFKASSQSVKFEGYMALYPEKDDEEGKKEAPIPALLEEGKTPEDILKIILRGFDIEFNETVPICFYCNCSKERFAKGLISLGKKELKGLMDEGVPAEVNCNFCGKHYAYSVEELSELYRKL